MHQDNLNIALLKGGKMFKNLAKEKREKGFTIIEVLIVLAIAGLILVIVLVAVPQLQRNQRNEGRRADAARVGTSVSNWMANNGGSVFPTAAGPLKTAAIDAVTGDIGKLGQYDVTVAGTFDSIAGSSTNVTVTDLEQIRVVTGAKCQGSGIANDTGATSRQFAVLYASENNGGDAQEQCIDV